jgi:hypothetical protein
MEDRMTTQRLLALRKITRAIADLLRNQVREHLATMTPVLRPANVLGEYVQGHTRGSVRGAEKAFRDLQALYEAAAGSKPFGLPRDLKAPIEILSSTAEISPMEYTHNATAHGESKTVTVTSPLKWVLSYSGFGPLRLRELVDGKAGATGDLSQFLLHILALHVTVAKQRGLIKIFELLRFPISTEQLPGVGDIPVTCISSAVSTVRPPDDVIIESTEISGMNVFEEIVNLEDIRKLKDPFQEPLMELLKGYGEAAQAM